MREAGSLAARGGPHEAGPVAADLVFIAPSETKPVFHSAALAGGVPRVFFETERHRVQIADLRPRADALKLDREGFELHRHRSALADFGSDAEVTARYYPEIEALLEARLGAARVAVFDVTRRTDRRAGAATPAGARPPAGRVHVDYTRASGPRRMRDVLGDEAAQRVLEGRARAVQINVWRPTRGPVERTPLALADASSIRPENLVATDQVFPERVGEIYHLRYADAQRWYYAPRMSPEEVLLIKSWDSLDDGRARFTPHGAFELPETPRDAAPRESIEVRTFALLPAPHPARRQPGGAPARAAAGR